MIDFNYYYMLVALAVREKANCLRHQVGAIIVKDNRIIGTGYNGTPEGMPNCDQEGCSCCKMKQDGKHSSNEKLLDKCICVHAEQNALITAARFGNSIEGATLYTTYQPCFTCAKEFLQAKIETVFYLEKFHINRTKIKQERKRISSRDKEKNSEFEKQYAILLARFPQHPTQLKKEELKKYFNNMKKNFNEIK